MWALTLSSVEDFRGRKRNIKLTEMEHKIQNCPSTYSRCVGRRDEERAADWDFMLPVCPENKPTLKHNGMIDDLWANNSFINYNLIYERNVSGRGSYLWSPLFMATCHFSEGLTKQLKARGHDLLFDWQWVTDNTVCKGGRTSCQLSPRDAAACTENKVPEPRITCGEKEETRLQVRTQSYSYLFCLLMFTLPLSN